MSEGASLISTRNRLLLDEEKFLPDDQAAIQFSQTRSEGLSLIPRPTRQKNPKPSRQLAKIRRTETNLVE
jgi:hypothetical protein